MIERIAIAIVYLCIGVMFGHLWQRQPITERGWVGCENGTMWAKNIDIAADTFKLPEGHYLLNLDGRYCVNQGGGAAG